MPYTVSRDDAPSPGDVKILTAGLAAHRQEAVGSAWIKTIAFFLRGDSDEIIGGVYGNFGSFNWLYVDTLWVSPAARGKGHGRVLMDHIESEAAKNDCHSAFLSTFSFQAPEFYKKLGYEVFGELEAFPAGYQRIFLRKHLKRA